MEYTINVAITDQQLSADNFITVNGTVALIRCCFAFDESWDDFPARQAIFKNSSDVSGYIMAVTQNGCLVPWEALKRAGVVQMALVGSNTDGQVQRTETQPVVVQTKTLQGGTNGIEPTPDQYAQFIADVEDLIGQAGVLSVNGMTGDVTLTASDVGALPDSTVIPSRTSQLTNDSGFLSAIPAEYVTETELGTALAPKANTADLATVATTGNYNDLSNKPTIPSVPVQSVNGKTGAVVLDADDVGALPDTTTASDLGAYIKPSTGIPKTDLASAVQTSLNKADTALQSAPVTSVNGQTGAVTLSIPTVSSTVTTGGTDAINSVALIAYINSLDADNTEY